MFPYSILGFEVKKKLRGGFLEAVYQEALEIEQETQKFSMKRKKYDSHDTMAGY
jgi:hypothetical protein